MGGVAGTSKATVEVLVHVLRTEFVINANRTLNILKKMFIALKGLFLLKLQANPSFERLRSFRQRNPYFVDVHDIFAASP